MAVMGEISLNLGYTEVTGEQLDVKIRMNIESKKL
jgi:hypothetical protein